jgi:hypothetical protein
MIASCRVMVAKHSRIELSSDRCRHLINLFLLLDREGALPRDLGLPKPRDCLARSLSTIPKELCTRGHDPEECRLEHNQTLHARPTDSILLSIRTSPCCRRVSAASSQPPFSDIGCLCLLRICIVSYLGRLYTACFHY